MVIFSNNFSKCDSIERSLILKLTANLRSEIILFDQPIEMDNLE
jgi:hypothetical protein